MKQTHKTLPNNGQIIQDNMINEIKNDLNTHEENFEKVQDNFIKINDEIYQMQNNQAIFNDMIKTLKESTDKFQKQFETKINEIIKAQSVLTEQVMSFHNNLENQSVKKNKGINEKITMQNKDEKTNKEDCDVKENEDDINEYDFLIDQDQQEHQGNNLDIPNHSNGLISTLFKECTLENNDVTHIEKINLFTSTTSSQIQIVNSQHNLISKVPKQPSINNKIENNLFYAYTSPTELNELENNAEFDQYLKKFIIPVKNIENVLDIDFEFQTNDNNRSQQEGNEDDIYITDDKNNEIEDYDIEEL
jgi:hypothetical protein